MMSATEAIDHKAAVEAAERAVRDVERLISAEVSAARQAVEAKYEGALSDARRERARATAAKEAADIAAAQTHPLAGKRVQRKVRKSGWSRDLVDQLGVVEIFTRESAVPLNQRYMRQSIGDPIVRLLKKDGTPGLKIERLSPEWKAV